MNVLLIEPDSQLGPIYAQALGQAGHSVQWQRAAQGAIEAADKISPDVVVLELQLARHNGVEFLYEFRSYPDWQDVPIILHTTVPILPLSSDLLERLGVRSVLYKPNTTLAQLCASVDRLPVPTA